MKALSLSRWPVPVLSFPALAVFLALLLLLERPGLLAAQTVPLSIALDAPDLQFSVGGGSETGTWVGQSDFSYDGRSAAYLHQMDPGEASAWIETSVVGPGDLTFWWIGERSIYGGGLTFSIDVTNVFLIPDAGYYSYWYETNFSLPEGIHVLRWSSLPKVPWAGSEQVLLVDQVRFSPIGSPATVTLAPQTRFASTNASISLIAFAKGSPPLAYQWMLNGSPILHATNSVFNIERMRASDAGAYRIVVSNAYGWDEQEYDLVLSSGSISEALDTANLQFVLPTPSPYPWWDDCAYYVSTNDFVSGPSSVEFVGQRLPPGWPKAPYSPNRASLSCSVLGPGTLSFWWKLLTPVSSSQSMSFACMDGDHSEASRTLHVSSDWRQESIFIGAGMRVLGWSSSDDESCSIVGRGWLDKVEFVPGGTAPFVVVQPQSTTCSPVDNATFSVSADGTPPFSYQWCMDGTNLIGEVSAQLVVPIVGRCRSNVVFCIVSNESGVAFSEPAVLRSFGCPLQAAIAFTCVSFINDCSAIRGVVKNVAFSNYVVAPFIQAWIGWWNKPYWDVPTVPIDPETGEFSFDYCTGGIDFSAASMAVFLVPKDYSVPQVGGGGAFGNIPDSIYTNAIAWQFIDRVYSPTVTIRHSTNGALTFSIQGSLGHQCYLEATSDLEGNGFNTSSWTPLPDSTNTWDVATEYPHHFPAGARQQFFRARALPCW